MRPLSIAGRIPALLVCLVFAASCGSGATTPTATLAEPAASPTVASAPAATVLPEASPTGSVAPTSAPLPTPQPAPTLTPEPEYLPTVVADGIQIRKILETGGGYMRIVVDPTTSQIYYMDQQANIYRLDVQSEDASTGEQVYSHDMIGGSANTTGMAFGPDGTLYIVSNEDAETRNKAIIRKGVPDGAGGRTWSTLAETEPYEKSNTQFDHVVNGIAVSPDGAYVYINSGSRTDHGEVQSAEDAFPGAREVPLTSAIFRIPTDQDNQVLPNDEEQLKAQGYLFADGTRNSYDLVFAPNGDLLAGDNGPDADYADELNWLQEGRHYGFPWRLGNNDNPQQSPEYDPATDQRLHPDFFAVQNNFYTNDPDFPAPEATEFTDPIANLGPDADQERGEDGSPVDASEAGHPAYSFTPHRSPLGLVFDAEGALAEPYTSDGFILSWGAAAGDLSDYGRDLLQLELTKNGDSYEMKVTQLVRDFEQPIDSVLLGNKLYVLDWGGKGSIWELTLPNNE